MKHRAGLDRSQTLLFPERLEEYIAAENPVRFLDAFVGSLDLSALGFAKARCADTGRPPLRPGGAAQALPLWLSAPGAFVPDAGGRMPAQRGSDLADGQTGARLQNHCRLSQGQPLTAQSGGAAVHVAVPNLELFGGELLAIDGSKFTAVNARDQNFNAAKLQDLNRPGGCPAGGVFPATRCRGCRRTGWDGLEQK